MTDLLELPQDVRRRAGQVFAGTESAVGAGMLLAAVAEVTCGAAEIKTKARCIGD